MGTPTPTAGSAGVSNLASAACAEASMRTDAGSLRPAAFSRSRTRISASFHVATCCTPSLVRIRGFRRRSSPSTQRYWKRPMSHIQKSLTSAL
jgi:hypothetical protein